MTLKEYVKDRTVFVLINVILFIIIGGIMILVRMNVQTVFLVFCIWFFPLITYVLIEYFKQKIFYNELTSIMDNLDQKYLLPEVIKKPETVEGKALYEVLRQANKDMHEHVKSYRDRENEYREYIETWIHEIKTPIASTRLIIENNQNGITRNIQEVIMSARITS